MKLQYRDRWPTPEEACLHAAATSEDHNGLWVLKRNRYRDDLEIISLHASDLNCKAARYVCWETSEYNMDDGREYGRTYHLDEDADEIGPVLIAPIDRDGNAVEWPNG